MFAAVGPKCVQSWCAKVPASGRWDGGLAVCVGPPDLVVVSESEYVCERERTNVRACANESERICASVCASVANESERMFEIECANECERERV